MRKSYIAYCWAWKIAFYWLASWAVAGFVKFVIPSIETSSFDLGLVLLALKALMSFKITIEEPK